MNFINHLNVKTRILILVLIPIVAVFLLAVDRYRTASDTLDNVSKLEILEEYIVNLSSLNVEMLQERLYSKLYMGPSPDSPIGLEHKASLMRSRSRVDTALQNYNEFVSDRQRLSVFPTLLTDIESVEEQFLKLAEIRDLVDKRIKNKPDPENPGKKIWVNAYLNATVKILNESSKQVVILAASDQELSLLANAYQNAAYAQDIVTQQTIAIQSAITRNIVINTFGDIMEFWELELAYLTALDTFATGELATFVDDQLLTLDIQRQAHGMYFDIRKQIKKLIDKPYGVMSESEWLDLGKRRSDAYTTVLEKILSEFKVTRDRLMKAAQNDVRNTIILLVVLVTILVLVSLQMIKSINSPLKALVNDFTKLTESKDMNLRSKVSGQNELGMVGRAFNALVEVFGQTLAKVRSQIVSMDDTTNSVSTLMEGSIRLIEEQRESTDSISVAVNQMTSTIHEVSEMSLSTSDTVKRAYDLSASSENDAKASQARMNDLTEQLGDTTKLVENLNDEAGQISSILQVIKGISEQTNLLALNAAIEAARAGEQGRGFAVVADEVRELSRRTHESTEQIQAQIETLISGAANVTSKMEQLQDNGVETVEMVNKSTAAFVTIKSELDQITDMASQIAVAAEEQTNVADEINQRIHKIKDGSDSIAEQGGETLRSMQTLLENGAELKRDIEVFHF